MTEPVFLDASAWVAIANKRDKNNPKATRLFRQLVNDNIPMITTTWTTYEALSLVKARAGYAQVEALWEMLNNQEIIELIDVSKDMESAGLEMFFRYKDKTWGMVDWVSFVVMEKFGCKEAFAFDKHFREAGRQYGFGVRPD